MNKLFFCLLLTFPIACSAENISCKYSSSFIEETIPTDSNIQRFEWKKQRDPDSDEHVTKLEIIYKNHNTAVIEHKYCDMYNFGYTYSVNKNSDALSKTNIVKYIVEGFEQSKLKPKFKTSLNKIILHALNQHKYNANNSLSIGLPIDQIIYNDNVEYGIEYILHKNGPAAATLIFYMSVGGE